MIRLFPTSLSLSESDIQFHLHQVDIYHGLRRQGFKQHEITRHLADYRLSIVPGAANFPDGYPTKIPSTVELALRQADQSCAREPLPEQEPDITIGYISRSPFIAHEIEDTEEWVQGDGAAEPTSPIALPQQLRKTSHAPRKSSLLRFSKAAASDSPPPPDTQDLISPASASCLPSMRYTRRSHASPSQSALNSLDEDGISATLSRIAISDFTTHSSSRVSPLQDSELSLPQVSTPRQDCHPDGTMESFWPSSSSDLTDSSSQNSDLRHSLAALDDIPSSPPLGSSSPESYPAASSSGVTRNIPPRTPILSQTHLVDNRTEPRRYRHRFLDGNAFSVYNDSLPANDQPQTPADLSRRPVLTEYEASYTAPPGMIRNVSTSARALGPAIELGQGDVSPLARTINLTYRRTQEMRRSVRSNLDRIRRESELVQRIREIGLDQPDEPVTWMDEFELDRLGEENFESELDLNLRTIRVVSGNAHWDSLTDVER
ncbi:hypothetical protein B0A52_02655 [Exophiala mesophila]|uniref:Uncharacterized protein n=1 Tax=Exophiala mesophila TaxID=212818 RepID=A0A438NDN0_EXOME|nr:hypothetical protein B0A52_02655 [Exophiala mesophila]